MRWASSRALQVSSHCWTLRRWASFSIRASPSRTRRASLFNDFHRLAMVAFNSWNPIFPWVLRWIRLPFALCLLMIQRTSSGVMTRGRWSIPSMIRWRSTWLLAKRKTDQQQINKVRERFQSSSLSMQSESVRYVNNLQEEVVGTQRPRWALRLGVLDGGAMHGSFHGCVHVHVWYNLKWQEAGIACAKAEIEKIWDKCSNPSLQKVWRSERECVRKVFLFMLKKKAAMPTSVFKAIAN